MFFNYLKNSHLITGMCSNFQEHKYPFSQILLGHNCGPCFFESDTCGGGQTRHAESCEECCRDFHGKSYMESLDGKCCTCKQDDSVTYPVYYTDREGERI